MSRKTAATPSGTQTQGFLVRFALSLGLACSGLVCSVAATPPTTKTAAPSTSPSIDPQGENWHQWRGPHATGISPTARPPLKWSRSENVQWRVPVPGRGNASPIIWDKRVFLLTAVNTKRVDPGRPKPEDQPKRVFGITHPNTFYQFIVLCYDRDTGEELWRDIASEHVPHEGTHHDADFASASPTTDGSRLYCWFGSAGMYCYDLEGKRLWERDLGKAYVGASLGEGCSPVIHKDRLIVVRDQERQSKILVLDAATGETIWEKDRDEPNAWATPLVVEQDGRTQVVTAASNRIRSYDLATGEILWECGGLTGNVTPCPVQERDLVLCMSGYKGHAVLAISLDSRGDITGTNKVRWRSDRGTPYVPSPLLYDGLLYFTQSNQAILTGLDAQTGKVMLERARIPNLKSIYSSPVGAGSHVFLTDREGTTVVYRWGDHSTPVSVNRLNEQVHSSPALAGNQLFLRTRDALYCLGEKQP